MTEFDSNKPDGCILQFQSCGDCSLYPCKAIKNSTRTFTLVIGIETSSPDFEAVFEKENITDHVKELLKNASNLTVVHL